LKTNTKIKNNTNMKILDKDIISATYDLSVEFENNRYNVIFTSAETEDRVESIWSEQLDDVLDEHDPEHRELYIKIADEVEKHWQLIINEHMWADYMATVDQDNQRYSDSQTNMTDDFKTFNEAPYGND
jgi:hypothetical protein